MNRLPLGRGLAAVALLAIVGAAQGRLRPAVPGAPTLTANERYVYLFSNGTLYQFDAETLRLRRQVAVPASAPSSLLLGLVLVTVDP